MPANDRAPDPAGKSKLDNRMVELRMKVMDGTAGLFETTEYKLRWNSLNPLEQRLLELTEKCVRGTATEEERAEQLECFVKLLRRNDKTAAACS